MHIYELNRHMKNVLARCEGSNIHCVRLSTIELMALQQVVGYSKAGNKNVLDNFTIREVTPGDIHEVQASSHEFSDSFLRMVDKINVSIDETGEVTVEVIYG